jgi:hypothetical protein
MNEYHFDNNFPRMRIVQYSRSSVITFRYNLQRNISNAHTKLYICNNARRIAPTPSLKILTKIQL